METDRLQYTNTSSPWPSSSSSLPPLQDIPYQSFIGSLVSLITKIDVRYEGVLFYINTNNDMLGLCNVICHGTEGRNNNNNGSQIPPDNQVYTSVYFNGNQIKEMIMKPITNLDFYVRFGIAKGATSIMNKPNYASKPPLPRILSSPSASSKMIRQKIPLIKPQDTYNTDSNALAPPDLSFNDHWSYHNNNQSMPYNGLPPYQDHHQSMMPSGLLPPNPNHQYMPYGLPPNTSYATNDVMVPPTNSLQSVFTTFPPAPISLKQNPGVFDFGRMYQKFDEYKLWIPKKKDTKATYNIDGSVYMKSRLPFEDIGRPYNPFGPIVRPPWKQETFIDWSYDLRPQPSNYRGRVY